MENSKIDTNKIRNARMAIVSTLTNAGITDNKDIIQVVKPLTNADKLRGIKRSITVAGYGQKAKNNVKQTTAQKGKIISVITVAKAKPATTTFAPKAKPRAEVVAPDVKPQDLSKPDDLASAKIRGFKAEISRLCMREARKNISANNMTAEDIMENDREVYREPFRTLYHEFDSILANRLQEHGLKLSDYGLGFKLDKNSVNYMDKVANAGFITHMYAVAKNLYGSK
jgi:hypothetical protein